jgi:hypothetical protein
MLDEPMNVASSSAHQLIALVNMFPDRMIGEISKSADIWKRSRSLRTMDMLSSRLPVAIHSPD